MLAFAIEDAGSTRTWFSIASPAVMVWGLVMFAGLVLLGERWSRDHFQPDEPGRLVGWPFRRTPG